MELEYSKGHFLGTHMERYQKERLLLITLSKSMLAVPWRFIINLYVLVSHSMQYKYTNIKMYTDISVRSGPG